MADPRCVVCRRSVDEFTRICKGCVDHFMMMTNRMITNDDDDLIEFAARRAWEFADSLLDLSPKRQARAPVGDPGPSRWRPGRRRR